MNWTRVLIVCLLVVMIPMGLDVWTGSQPTEVETSHQAASHVPEPYEPEADDGVASYVVLAGVGIAALAVGTRALSADRDRS